MPRKPVAPNLSFLNTPALSSNVFVGASADIEPVRQVDVTLLDDNPFQPREKMDAEQLEQLAEVIGAQGFQGTLVARTHPDRPNRYQLAFGHRRREAARLAGLRTLPIQLQDLDDRDMIAIAITENIQREDLTPLEEGRTYLLMREQLKYKQEEIATAVGKTRGYIVNRLRLAEAPADVQAFLEEKPDSIRAAATLVQIDDPAERAVLMDGMRSGTLTTNDLPTYRREKQALDAEAVQQLTTAEEPAEQHTTQVSSAPRQPTTKVEAPGADAEKRSQERAAKLKLATVMQSLTKYEELAAARGAISLAEYTTLAELRGRIERLYSRYSPSLEENLLS